jgi:hypothetical protein
MIPPRRAIVEVRSGSLLGAKALLLPGESLRIGRTERAHLVVARDPQMSGLHCSLSWDGERCLLRDEKSARGTMLAGKRIEGEAEVPHGSWIMAGETSFSLFFEAETPPREAEPLEPEIAAEAHRALARLREAPRLYAVLDAARDERILQLLHEAPDDHRSLYEGVQGEALADVAPYLVSFRKDSALLDRLVEEGWGRAWGIFLTSKKPFKDVRRHLRRFLMVEDDETRERLYFRFYDPRVLREVLPIATVRQEDEIFEGIDSFLCEGERGEVAVFDAPRGDDEA